MSVIKWKTKTVCVLMTLATVSCSSVTTVTWDDEDVIFIKKEFSEVNTWEGPRKSFGDECTKFKLIGKKDKYLTGEFYMSHDCFGSNDDIRLITKHYSGSIKIDKVNRIIDVNLFYTTGGAFPENGKYRYERE